MNPEKWLIKVVKSLYIKFLIFFICAISWSFKPKWSCIINRLCVVLNLVSVCIFCYNSLFFSRIEINLIRHKVAVFEKQITKLILVKKFFFIFSNVHNDRCTMLCASTICNFIGCASITYPMYRL